MGHGAPATEGGEKELGQEQQHTTLSSHNPKTWSTAEGMGCPTHWAAAARPPKALQTLERICRTRWDTACLWQMASAEPTYKAHQVLMEPRRGLSG